jgi:hypothetical protein
MQTDLTTLAEDFKIDLPTLELVAPYFDDLGLLSFILTDADNEVKRSNIADIASKNFTTILIPLYALGILIRRTNK